MFKKGNQIWKGRKHTVETRHKMSEAHRGIGERRIICHTPEEGYRLLILAVLRQAVKDGAAWFFETERGKGYCAVAGVNPVKLMGERV
ncbi:MAG: hypothetical protein LBU82_01350 [Treponema sp.]|jgi:hypothetical protein|nr:hypothetical protein [Treponema sp.]